MNTHQIIAILNTINNGSWFKATWTSDLPLKAEWRKMGKHAYKTTTAQCRKGIKYARTKQIKEKIAKGYELKHELTWGSWKPGYEGLLIEHKGEEYLRLYLGPNKPTTKYYIDNVEYTWDELKETGMIQDSFFSKSEKPVCFSIKTRNIQNIQKKRKEKI